MRVRELNWEGCLNVRDLGGLPVEGAGETRFGVVVRADSVRRLSDAGWAAFVGYGVERIVDLRFHSELAADPPAELPVEVVHVPVLPDPGSSHWDEIEAAAARAESPAAATRVVYLEFLERFRGGFARAVGEVARPAAGTVVVHCLGGKDRTGLVTALLLRLVGVGADEVARDYALSERNLLPRDGAWIEAAEDEQERERRSRIAASPREAMAQVLDELDRRYGGARAYLRAAGAAEEDLDRVRARLRAAAS